MHGKRTTRGVDVWGQHFDAHGAHFVDVLDDLIGVLHVLSEQGGHEFHRIVGLEVGSMVCHQSVGGRVGLIETVGGKLLHQIEDRLGLLRVKLVLLGAGHEEVFLLGHLFGFLLAHGPTQQVGAAEAVVTQNLADEHNLLLVDDDPVGIFQDWLKLREVVGDLFFAVLAQDEVIDHTRAEGAGAIEGTGGDNIFKAARLKLDQHLLHARRLELKDAGGIAGRQQTVGLCVIVTNQLEIELGILTLADQAHRVVDNGQSFKTEKVEFNQTDLLDELHGELSHLSTRLGIGIQGQVFRQGLGRYHHPGGVSRSVASQALKSQGYFQQFGHLGFFVGQFLEFRLLCQRLLQGDIEYCRHQLGDFVNITVGNIEGTTDITHHPFGHHGTKGDDLGDVGLAVFLPHVVDDLFTAIDTEVDVDIGHRHSLWVKKPLKEQVIRHGVDIGNADGIGHQTAGGATTAGADRYPIVLGPVDKVSNNQKVTGKAHGTNGFQLDFKAVAIVLFLLGRKVGAKPANLHQAFVKTLARIVSKHFV